MQSLQKSKHGIDFNINPMLKAYEQIAVFNVVPKEELVMDLYDMTNYWKAKDFFPEINIEKGNQFTINGEVLSNAKKEEIERLTGTRTILHIQELMDVLDYKNMMYADRFGLYHNMAAKGVW